MIMSFHELKSEEHVLNLVFCLNYFDHSQSVGRWSVVLIKPFTLLCLIVGVIKLQILGRKNPILGSLDNFPPGAFYSTTTTPPTPSFPQFYFFLFEKKLISISIFCKI